MAAGARLAEPGEFTFRAFLRGRIDLVQAEAVRDLVDAVTPLQARAAFDQLEGTLTAAIREIDAALFDLSARLEASLDFPEEGYHFVEPGAASREILAVVGRIDVAARRGAGAAGCVREGAQVAIVGRPNTGKSSLFNRLAGAGRAIVTDIPGTTRDLVTEVVDIDGAAVTLVDTAGLHGAAADAVEEEGIARARAAQQVADLAIVVLDRSRPLTGDDRELIDATSRSPRVVVGNKSDLAAAWPLASAGVPIAAVSAADGQGLDALRRAIVAALAAGERLRDTPGDHERAPRRPAVAGGGRAAAGGATRPTPARRKSSWRPTSRRRARVLEEVTGARTPDDVLHAIFDRFCIGK